VRLPAGAELLGPLPVLDGGGSSAPAPIRYLIRVPRSAGLELAAALRDGQAARSAAKEPGSVRVQVDPAV
jgi:primosomal protein N' (replication factor Y)